MSLICLLLQYNDLVDYVGLEGEMNVLIVLARLVFPTEQTTSVVVVLIQVL